MSIPRILVSNKSADTLKSQLTVYFVPQKADGSTLEPAIFDSVKNSMELGDFAGKASESFWFYPDKKAKASRVLVMGLGKSVKKDKDPESKFDLKDRLRKIGGDIAGISKKLKASKLVLSMPKTLDLGDEIEWGDFGECLVEGILLGDYRFEKYREISVKKDAFKGISSIEFAGKDLDKNLRPGVKRGKIAALAARTARDMANEPGNGWTSKEFASHAEKLAKEYDLKYTCLKKKDMEKLGMGGILAVNQGSAIPPRMVILEYRPAKKADTLLLVGKGITFDSGGISIKPSGGMEDMKYDMCGGAAVLSVMAAVGEEKPKVGVVAIVPATDNMSGSEAVRPGDVIRHFNKVTAEIVNTDAEGRMILGDALAYGIKTYKPRCVVDIATLTGAVVVGLGHHHTGLFSNDDELCKRLMAAGDSAGEPLWRLPLTEAYKKQIESRVADIKNTGGRPGGSITAAAYLSNFVGETPWAHLDIAGTAWDFTEKSYIPKGPSGIGTRTFLELIRQWKKWK